MTGFTAEELSRKNMSDWFEGEDAIRVAAAVDTVFRTGYGEVEANLLIKGGKKILIHSNGVRLSIDGKTYFVGVGIDITERKRAEEKLKETNTLLRIAGATAKLGGWSIILDSDQVLWSDEVASIHEKPAGYSPLLQDAIGFYAPEWRELIEERFGDCSQKGIPYDEEMEIITAKGNKVWVRSIGEAVRNDAGKIIKVQGSFQDISGQKKTELNLQTKNEEYESLNEELRSSVEALRIQNEELFHSDETLRKSEERYRLLLANLEAGIVVHAPDTAIIMSNPRASELLGLSDDQLKGRKAVDPTWKFVYVDGTPLPLAEYPVNRIAATRKPIESQVLGVHQPAKDSLVWLTVNGFPVLDKTGNIAEILVSFIDITERKRIGDALRQSEANFREVFDNIAHAVFIVDVMEDGGFRVGKSNKAQKIIAAISLEAEPGRLLEEAFPPEIAKILHANYRRAIESGKPIAYEEDVDLPGVGRRYYYTVISPVRNEAGRFYRIIGSTIDITDRTLAEERTKALLAEKELVLKEVNHRIKNNMAAMESLLRLQAGAIKEPIAVGALEDAGKRMQSMRLLYEKLYQSIGFTELPMANYVSPLIDEILTNFPGASSVKIEKHIDNFILDAKRLQPLGIIINELLTNIMKYAFADKSRGIITVSAVLVNGLVRLIVQDNGTGIPKSIDFENSPGFGLTLVHALAEQLDGEIRIERLGGTSIILDFEL